MTLIHPWAIGLGAVAVGLPILVHWLTRPRPVRMPLSTIRFVQEVVRERRARHLLRDILVLALRALAVLLIGWAFARPIQGPQSQRADGEDARVARVVMLDVSQSMAAQQQGVQAFERARSLAARYLAAQYGLQADVILAGATARPIFDTLSGNVAAQREELAKSQVRPERLNVQAAVARAAELLACAQAGKAQRREFIVISDFQQTSWAQADFSALPKDVVIDLESVAPAQTPPNVALLRCGVQGLVEPGRTVRLEAEVANYSPVPRRVQVEFTVGHSVYRADGVAPPMNSVTLSSEAEFCEPGWLTGQGRLLDCDDALPADNVRPIVVQVQAPASYALITRQPVDRIGTSSYYLAKALAPVPAARAQSGANVRWLSPACVDREALSGTHLIVLDHPGQLSSECISLLAGLLRYGRPILYIAAEDADATNLRLLSEAAGGELRLPAEFMPLAQGKHRRDLSLAEVRRDQPPFSVFGEGVLAAMQPLRFSGGLPTWRRGTGLADDILAVFNDKSVCLVATTCGQGSLAVLNADLAASDLPRSPAFVPLIGELVARLHGSRQAGKTLLCGEPAAAYLPAEAGLPAGLRLAGPDGASDMGDLLEDGMGVLWRWQGPAVPGAYQVVRGQEAVYAVAAAIAPEESDLRSMAPATLTGRLAGGREIHYQGQEVDRPDGDEVWPWLVVMCLACLLGEVLALRAFRS